MIFLILFILSAVTLLFGLSSLLLKDEDINILYVEDDSDNDDYEVQEQLVADEVIGGDTVTSFEDSGHASIDMDALASELLKQEFQNDGTAARGL